MRGQVRQPSRALLLQGYTARVKMIEELGGGGSEGTTTNLNLCEVLENENNDMPRTLSNLNSPKRKQTGNRANNYRNNPRNSPHNSPRNSPRKSSRLPIRSGPTISKFLLRLPVDESVSTSLLKESSVKVTPEKLMQELRVEVKRNCKNTAIKVKIDDEEDDEIILNVPYKLADDQRDISKPRMSLRNRCPIILDAPDLIYEDPLEVARQTLRNTRANSGYRHIKLIYTTERRTERPRESSPEPAFSRKLGISRHFLNFDDDDDKDKVIKEKKKLKFDRVLKLFDGLQDEVGDVNKKSPESLVVIPKCAQNQQQHKLKSCLKQQKPGNPCVEQLEIATNIVHIRRICYDDDFISASPVNKSKRKLGNNGAAKRLKKID